jgi:Ni,Fe-hydrogenase III component G
MAEEQTIQAELTAKFPFLAEKIRIQRERRIWAEAPREQFYEVFDFVVKGMKFPILCTITGLDEGATFGAIYHLARESGVILSLRVYVPKEQPVLKTVTSYFPAADHYERELKDLFGMQIEGLAEGTRYPLPDNWPANEFPLRKDWKPKAAPQSAPPADGGVK